MYVQANDFLDHAFKKTRRPLNTTTMNSNGVNS